MSLQVSKSKTLTFLVREIPQVLVMAQITIKNHDEFRYRILKTSPSVHQVMKFSLEALALPSPGYEFYKALAGF